MLRQTNYGVWVDDDGTLNENERAINYIIQCARDNGIEVIEGETALSISFMAKVMEAMNRRIIPVSVLDKIRAEIEQTAKDYDKFDDYRRVRGLWIALDIIDKYREEQ